MNSLDPKKDCQLTFKDIWNDYKHFKTAYYYTQVDPTPGEKLKDPKNVVEVDMKKFNLRQSMWSYFWYGNKLESKNSSAYLFSSMAQIACLIVIFKLVRKPYEWYYHFDDQLLKESKPSVKKE